MAIMHDYAAAQIERFLTDTCTITAGPGTAGVLDETTLTVTVSTSAPIYCGPCSITWASSLNARRYGFGDIVDGDLVVKLPAAATAAVRAGATIVCTASPTDPTLVDVELEVVRVMTETHRLTRRVVARRREALTSTGGAA